MSRSAVEFRACRPCDAEALASRLRQADLHEIAAGSGRDPLEALLNAVRMSVRCWTVEVDGQVEVMFGVGGSLMGDVGVPWLLGSDAIERHRRAFVRSARHYIPVMLDLFPTLRNMVHADNRVAVTWLKRAGFKMYPAIPYGRYGARFHPFEMRSSHV